MRQNRKYLENRTWSIKRSPPYSIASVGRYAEYKFELKEKCPRGQRECGFLDARRKIERSFLVSRKIFIMSEFRNDKMTKELIRTIKHIAREKKMLALLANDKTYCDDLYCNICLHMKTCKYGIAIFSKTTKYDFNPNVAYEIGFMHAEGKRCLLLIDKKIKQVPSDLISRIRTRFTYDNIYQIRKELRGWFRDIAAESNQ